MLKNLSENLALLALLVLLAGISSTESYYAYFGLSYQLLDLPSDHIAYRGLTAVFESFWITAIYIAAIAAVSCQFLLRLFLGRSRRVQWFNYLLVVLFSFTAWWAGRHVGQVAAREDATVGSRLPLVSRITLKGASSDKITAVDQFRLLLQSRDGAYIFRPVDNANSETPIVKFLSTEQIEELDLCGHC
jgi:hypothetical protein